MTLMQDTQDFTGHRTARSDSPHAQSAAPRRRTGYILIAVLGLVAIITTLGLSFISANGTAMPEAVNRFRSTRARYLAESGIALASRFILRPPTTVALDDYWRGITNLAVDTTSDFANVTVTRDSGDPNQFLVSSVGTAFDYDGTTVAAKSTINAKLLKPPDAKWHIPYALVRTSNASVPSGFYIVGDFHTNGSITGSGWCNGRITATALALWLGSGPPSAILSLQPSYSPPAVDLNLYKTYTIYDNTYTATNYNDDKLDSSSAPTWNATDVSATNPGRILNPKSGDFELRKDAQISGTLLVSGNFKFRENTAITAVNGFPALVVTGDIIAQNNNATLTVVGSVICGGGLKDNGKDGVALDVQGACILGNTSQVSKSGNWMRAMWNSTRSVFWDFTQTTQRVPMTVLSWDEN